MPKLLTSVTISSVLGSVVYSSGAEYAEAVPEVVLVQGRRAVAWPPMYTVTVMMPMMTEITARVQIALWGDIVLPCKQTEMGGHFLIAAHGVGDAGAGIETGERCTDQRQEHREGLDQHERLACSIAAEQPCADDDHHVADRRAGSTRHSDGVAVMQHVVGGEILDQVADRSLDHQ